MLDSRALLNYFAGYKIKKMSLHWQNKYSMFDITFANVLKTFF